MKSSRKLLTLKIFFGYASLTVLLLSFSACSIPSGVMWDGFTGWTFRVSVYDQATMTPVPDAEVSIIVKNEDSFGDIESFVKEREAKKCTTSSEGVCDITMNFNTYGTKSSWKSEAYVNFRHRNLLVQAEGYHPLNLPLKTFVETPHKLLSEEKSVHLSEIKAELNKELYQKREL